MSETDSSSRVNTCEGSGVKENSRMNEDGSENKMKQMEESFRVNENGHVDDKSSAVEEMRISVRGLVEFLLRQGNIDNRRHGGPDDAMQEGGRIHRMIQRRMGSEYQAEVFLRYTHMMKNYALVVEGRADGVIDTQQEVTIDEIKGTYRDLERMKEPVAVHLAQAKCYAYIYSRRRETQRIKVRMTYCNIETEDIRYFYEEYSVEELGLWFQGLITAYRKWSDYEWEWRRTRKRSIEELEFPFPYREGQKELASYVYQTIYHKKKLFLEAPTGVGKTISTVFPSIKAMGKGLADKIFYLTAKTITRTVAENTFELLRDKGLHFKSVILTAKEKTCFMEQTQCNPDSCPYAKGHYDRINDAVYDLLTKEESFSREKVEEYALRHMVCPFEMCLDMSLFADGVICDYNYLFDPHVYLKRFFGDGSQGSYIFLIDEAHNLLERGREMYSAALVKEEFLELKRELSRAQQGDDVQEEAEIQPGIQRISSAEQDKRKDTTEQQDELQLVMNLDRLSESGDGALELIPESRKRTGRNARSVLVRQGYASRMEKGLEKCNKQMLAMKRECDGWRLVEDIDGLVQAVIRLHTTMDTYLEEQEEAELPVRDLILDFYFDLCHFLDIYERVDENYVKYTQVDEGGGFRLKLFNVNPSLNLKECMDRGRSAILFSATFLPIQYYKGLLGGEKEDYEVYAQSVFNPEKRALLIANDVTSKYSRRSDEEYYNIARYIDEIVKNRHGNYMVFCPSYSFLQRIYDVYMEYFAGEDKECIIQQEYMKEQDREEFLGRFEGNEDCSLEQAVHMEIELDEEHTLIGFCVMGGIFSEGIDLKNDRLIGVIIVGTGIPQVCNEREILKNYFNARGENGFDYSYRYPGMNKVLQAAGRVIRTAEDIGIIALLDERFLQFAYQKMFPREWESFQVVSMDTAARRVERFWDSWL